MKIFKIIIIAVIILTVFYFGAIFLGFNLPKPGFLDKEISGSAVLEVKLVMNNSAQNPLANIEVDLGEKAGPPPKGGIAITNEQGIATFNIKPGNYVVFFNSSNFPKNLAVPAPKPVTVVDNQANETTILVDTANQGAPNKQKP